MFAFDLTLNNTFTFDVDLEENILINVEAPLSLYDNWTLGEMDDLTLGELDYTEVKGHGVFFDITLNNTFTFDI